MAAVAWDQPPVDRDAPMTLDELQAASHRVTGVHLELSVPHWISRPADNSRLVGRYRHHRILLAKPAYPWKK